MNSSILEFPISMYGEAEKVNAVLTKQRCRIFYKQGNRNGTYITDEFAEELINTLHYVPVKGIYDGDDYTDHGQRRDEGRIYGIVPENNNFAWETHVDEDGVERLYACTDVYLYTALYPEASQIAGKSLSMELYEPSLKYHMAIVQGQKYVVFDHGSFLGLQVLGDNVEPCFEGASFYSLQQSIEDAIYKIKEYGKLGGKSEMPKINFKLSDSQKHDYIWQLLNPEYNEDNGWTVSCAICDIYEDYVIAYNYETSSYERVYYNKNDDNDSVELGERIKVFIVDVTEKEFETLQTLKQLNGGNYDLVNENLVNAEQNAANCENFGIKIDELNNTISTLNTEVANAQEKAVDIETQYTAAQAQIATLSDEVEALKDYRKSIENQHKEAVVAEYSNKLSDEILDGYREKFDEYTAEELDMHLAYELKKSNASAFTHESKVGILPKQIERSGVEKILERYTK